MGQVTRPDEQDVDTGDGRDLLDHRYGLPALDLDDADDVVVRGVEYLRVQAESTGTGICGDPAVADRRVARVPDRLLRLLCRLDSGEHDPGYTEVEYAASANAVRGLDPGEHGDGACVRGDLL